MRKLRTTQGKKEEKESENIKRKEDVGVITVLREIDIPELRWHGHLERMEEERIAKNDVTGHPE